MTRDEDAAERSFTDPMPRDARRQAVAAALQADGLGEHYVPTEDGYVALPVASLPPQALVYRADNGRILSELANAAHACGTTLADFKARGETGDVQALLYRLLVTKARDPDGPIYDELARYGHQTEPLLIARDGLVVNGNRRLAAMQALRAADPESYAAFAEVRAAVLPEDIDPDRLEYIEAALQMAPELKLAYSWINRRLKLRQHVTDLDRERVARAYRFKDVTEIDTELAELALAEAYLAWRGTPGQFDLVQDQEERFVQLNARLGALQAGHMVDLWKRIGFAMLTAMGDLDRPVEHYFPFAKPAPGAVVHWVPRTLAAELGLAAPPEPGQVRHVNPALAGQLKVRIDAPDQAAWLARATMGLIDTLRSNEETYLGPERVVHHLRAARDALDVLGAETMPDRQLRRVRAEMAALEQHLEALRDGATTRRPMSRQQERRLPGAARWMLRKARTVLNG